VTFDAGHRLNGDFLRHQIPPQLFRIGESGLRIFRMVATPAIRQFTVRALDFSDCT
jgi:hypothetical protein